MRLLQRIKKLEDKSSPQEQAIIPYKVREKSQEQALQEWVEKYGPLGKREPLFIEIRTFSVD